MVRAGVRGGESVKVVRMTGAGVYEWGGTGKLLEGDLWTGRLIKALPGCGEGWCAGRPPSGLGGARVQSWRPGGVTPFQGCIFSTPLPLPHKYMNVWGEGVRVGRKSKGGKSDTSPGIPRRSLSPVLIRPTQA
jgi:hypothetical protein